jgi:group I intron endonuclease
MKNLNNLLIQLKNDKPIIINRKILIDYKKKSGVYLWYNNLTHDYYIGSSKNLYIRLNQYYYPSRLNTNQIINRALLKYGHENFSLILLKLIENQNDQDLKKLEQYYLNLLKPKYNILTKAYTSLGFKFNHSEAAKLKISQFRKNRMLSEDQKSKISNSLKGRVLSESTKIKISQSMKNKKIKLD